MILPESLKRVLYLDVDLIVEKSLAELHFAGFFPDNSAIYHFEAGDKPWLKRESSRYYEIWWKYARLTIHEI